MSFVASRFSVPVARRPLKCTYYRFEQLGGIEHLEESITCSRQGLNLCPIGDPNHSVFLHNFAIAITKRFQQLVGRMENLENSEAIICRRQALAIRPHGHPNRSFSLDNLANNMSTRFQQLGRMEDLEEAITCHRQALALFPHGHPNRYSSLNNLTISVFTRFDSFEQLGKTYDLEEAMPSTCSPSSWRPQLLSFSKQPCQYRVHSLSAVGKNGGLGGSDHMSPSSACSLPSRTSRSYMSTRFQQLGRMEDLEEAITCLRQAVALRPHGHPNRSSSLIILASVMNTCFQQSRSHDDLLDAVMYLSEAKNILPTGHPRQSTIKSCLASIFLIQYNVSKLDEKLHKMTKAFELFKNAADHSPASTRDRLDAAVTWGREAHRRDHPSAVHAFNKSLTLLGHRLILAPTIESQQNLLATVPKALALDAASSSINRKEFRTAIELLEQGRAVLWSKLRGYRHPLDKLRTIDKELFDRFETLSGQLPMSVESRLSASESSESDMEQPFGPSFEVKMQQHRILSEKWDDVVEKIRQVDGFTDFLLALPFSTLQTAAAEGPIIINVSRYRSDAIILQDVGDPVIVPLPKSLLTILARWSSQFATACAGY